MKLTVAMLTLAGFVYGQGSNPAAPVPRYDAVGHLVGYLYADGKSDHYVYDSAWRITRYTDRDGNVTVFRYGADDSMTIVNPDGSIGPR